MAVAPSLFDAPASPALASVSDWITGTLLGTVAIGLCVVAVAFVGLMLMTGRVPVREAARVVLGCFILLGAPAIALGLQSVAEGAALPGIQTAPVASETPVPAPLPPANYDPYAGASLRRD